MPPPAPVADIEDPFYPAEEAVELAQAMIPVVVSIASDNDACVLSSGSSTVTAHPGDVVFNNWLVQAIIQGETDVTLRTMHKSDSAARPAIVVLERRWKRWGLLVSATVGGATTPTRWDLQLRKPLGAQLSDIRTQQFANLTRNEPDYFHKAASFPMDYIGQRIMADSPHREASYLKAAKFLPPIADYTLIGDVRAPVKAVVTMNGKIKRSDGSNLEPVNEEISRTPHGHAETDTDDTPGCIYSAETKHVSVHDCAADGCKNHKTLAEAQVGRVCGEVDTNISDCARSYSPSLSFTHSPTGSLTNALTHSQIYSLPHSLTHSRTHARTHSSTVSSPPGCLHRRLHLRRHQRRPIRQRTTVLLQHAQGCHLRVHVAMPRQQSLPQLIGVAGGQRWQGWVSAVHGGGGASL